jgi:ribosome-binding protein aMBF1 (putative translation factor)
VFSPITKRYYSAFDHSKSKGWKHKDLLSAIGKENSSIITKWLSGTHNFTVDTLVELEQALNIRLIDLSKLKMGTMTGTKSNNPRH